MSEAIIVTRKLKITERDRLLAAGLLSFIVTFVLVGPSDYRYDNSSPYALFIVGVFAASALVFSISPLLRGSPVQKLLAILFILPSLVFIYILIAFLMASPVSKG